MSQTSRIQIDGKEVEAKPGMTVLEAAQQAGIPIPTVCHHEKLVPFGACRLCIVESEKGSWKGLVVSCIARAEDNPIVRTRSDKIDRFRKTLLELMMAHAPHSPQLRELAAEYGADANRFEPQSSFCIDCGLCVRYCAEVKQLNAVGFVDRGTKKEISFVLEIAAQECRTCKECFPLCPTSYLQGAFVLVESLAFPLPQKTASP